MKRSEVINLIEKKLYNIGVDIEGADCSVGEAVLSVLEEAGMTPPLVAKVIKSEVVINELGWIGQPTEITVYVPNWEDETDP